MRVCVVEGQRWGWGCWYHWAQEGHLQTLWGGKTIEVWNPWKDRGFNVWNWLLRHERGAFRKAQKDSRGRNWNYCKDCEKSNKQALEKIQRDARYHWKVSLEHWRAQWDLRVHDKGANWNQKDKVWNGESLRCVWNIKRICL